MYKDDNRRWDSTMTNVSDSYNFLLKKSSENFCDCHVRMTFKALVDCFVKRNSLAITLLQSEMSWPLSLNNFF